MNRRADEDGDELEVVLRDYYASRSGQLRTPDEVWLRLSRELHPVYTGPDPEELRNRFIMWGLMLLLIGTISIVLLEAGFFGRPSPRVVADEPALADPGRLVAGLSAAASPGWCDGVASLTCALNADPRIAEVYARGGAQEIEYPHQVDKWTLTLRVVYAGPKSILIAYNVRGPEVERYLQPITPTLTTVQGDGFSLRRRSSALGSTPSGGGGLEAGEANLFTGPALAGKSKRLQLRFVVPGLVLGQPTAPGHLPTRTVTGPVPASDVVVGPFVFSMVVPIGE